MLCALFLCLCTARAVEKDMASATFETAMALNIAGKGTYGQCQSYAQDLYGRLKDLGAEAHLVIYDWERDGRLGRHSIVVYSDGKGRYWGMDNMSRRPVWLEGTTTKAWASSFESRGSGNGALYAKMGVQVVSYPR